MKGGERRWEKVREGFVRHVMTSMTVYPLLPVGDHSSRDELSAKAAFSHGIRDMLTISISSAPCIK